MAILGVKNDITIDLSMSTASHGIGTGSCIPISTTQVAFSYSTISLVNLLTAILAPLFVALLM